MKTKLLNRDFRLTVYFGLPVWKEANLERKKKKKLECTAKKIRPE